MRIPSYVAILFLVMVAGCKKDNEIVSPVPTGIAYGTVGLMNGYYHLSNWSGVQISVEGTNIATTSDSAGNFKLTDVPTDSQSFKYSKAGFGTFKRYAAMRANESGFLSGVALFQLPTNTITALNAHFSNDTLLIAGRFSSLASGYSGVIIFVSRSASVSSDPASYVYAKDDYDAPTDSISFVVGITKGDLIAKSIVAGNTIYVVAYCSIDYGFNWREYYDKTVGKVQYNGIGTSPSNVVSVVVP
jgi:hypothetical protein